MDLTTTITTDRPSELSEGLRDPFERPTVLSLLEEFKAWLETPVLKPRLVYGRDIVPHPWDPYAFLFRPLNQRLLIDKDNPRHPVYRPLHSIKEYLKGISARRASEFYQSLLNGIAELCKEQNRWDLWTLAMQKGFFLPLQVRFLRFVCI